MRRQTGPGRCGLAPVELLLALPVWMMIAALMILVATTGVWRIRTQTVAREAAFRAVWPRTRQLDASPAEWFPPSASMESAPALTPVTLDDPLLSHSVIRGPRLATPDGQAEMGVHSEAMEPWTDVIIGRATLDHPATVWRRLGYHYRMEREFAVLSGEAGQFQPRSRISNDQRRAGIIWDLSF